ncbi:MAG: transposase [Anaerolineae bacterium]|nr:transposase [Anaerolineae bacterium]
MTTEDFIIELFCRVDDKMLDVSKHPQAKLYPSEVVTLALLFALKGVGTRAFYRWLVRDYRGLFPGLPERTRLFRAFNQHCRYTTRFWAEPSLIGLIDSFGIELIHPRREGRSPQQIGRKGLSNRRWIVGGKVCVLLNHLGLVVNWAADTANSYDGSVFQALVEGVADQMLVFADPHFVKKDWSPTNLKICKRGEWNSRMLVETLLSMLTVVCHFKHLTHRVWAYFHCRLAFTLAVFNLLVQWHGLKPDADGFVHLSLAEFSL